MRPPAPGVRFVAVRRGPTTLDLPTDPGPSERAARKTRHVTMNVVRDEYGLPTHLLNGRRFDDETVMKPQTTRR